MQPEIPAPYQTPLKKVSVTGTLRELGTSAISRNGKKYHRFDIVDKHQKVFSCWAYNEKADIAEKKLTKLDMEVNVYGVYKDDEAEAQASIWVNSFSSPQATLTQDEQLIKTYGSMSEARRRIAEVAEQRTAAGYILAQEMLNGEAAFRWILKQDAVEAAPGFWKSKIDYLMDTLGPTVVCDQLRQFVKGIKVTDGKSLLGAFDVVGYHKVLAEMLIEAVKVAPIAQIQQELAVEGWEQEIGKN